jgi:uncharacterized membrane protein YqjE
MASSNFSNETHQDIFEFADQAFDRKFLKKEEPFKSTYASLLREIGVSIQELIHNEIQLLTAELKLVSHQASQRLERLLLFGFFLVLSGIAFLSFLIMGLGSLMNDQYWMSALLVSLGFFVLGSPIFLKSYSIFKKNRFPLPQTKASFQQEVKSVKNKFDELKRSTIEKGENDEHP